jgi:hypothetical protein
MPSLPQLAAHARVSISEAYIETHQLSHPQSPQEPDFVATLVRVAVPQLASRWRAVVSVPRCKITGVFVHQSPMVSFTGTSGKLQRCELGDLLLVTRYRRLTGSHGVAALFQAKLGRLGYGILPAGPQRDLYQSWPTFKIASWRSTFNVGMHPEQGFLAAIDGSALPRRYSRRDVWNYQDIPMTTNRGGLGHLWAGLLLRKRGRPFTLPASATDDWSRLVERLLEETAGRVFFNRARIGIRNQPRGVTQLLFGVGAPQIEPTDGFAVVGDEEGAMGTFRFDVPPKIPQSPDGPGGRGFGAIIVDIDAYD